MYTRTSSDGLKDSFHYVLTEPVIKDNKTIYIISYSPSSQTQTYYYRYKWYFPITWWVISFSSVYKLRVCPGAKLNSSINSLLGIIFFLFSLLCNLFNLI